MQFLAREAGISEIAWLFTLITFWLESWSQANSFCKHCWSFMYSAWHESGPDTQAGASSKVQMEIPVPLHTEQSMHKARRIVHVPSQNSQPSKREGFLKKGEKTAALTICWWAIHPLHPNSQLSTNIYTAQGYSYSCNISAQILGHNLSSSELASVALQWFTIAELLSPIIFFLSASDQVCPTCFFQMKSVFILR